jgi:uncharacterized protein (TIGR02391 family)
LLPFLQRQRQPAGVAYANYLDSLFVPNRGGHKYTENRKTEIALAISEAWSWLEVQGLLVTAPGINGADGWRIFSRRAQKMKSAVEVTKFAKARRIQKDALNPRIAEKVWSAFMRAEFDVAVFQAIKAVEVTVREAGGYGPGDLGVPLMRAAFHEDTGPLTDMTTEKSERQARAHLFAGAIGAYKNALSHRDIDIEDADEAIELVLLANHLLRIVDRRKAAMSAKA